MNTTPGPPALEAFFRQHDRLASVVVELAGATPIAANSAVAGVMSDWLAGATPEVAAHWAVEFWSAVVWSPRVVLDHSPALVGPLAPLSAMPVPARLAVLLRLAGLDDAGAAAVTRQSLDEFRTLLARGLPRKTDGSIDGERWQDWAQALRVHASSMSPDRALRLAAARSGHPLPEPEEVQPAESLRGEEEGARRPRWHWVAGIAVLTAAALLSTWVVERYRYGADGTPRIRTVALAPSGQPVRTSAVHGTVDSAEADAALVSDLSFLAWYAHQREQNSASVLQPLPDVPESAAATNEPQEASDGL